jgi:hypothetical protein
LKKGAPALKKILSVIALLIFYALLLLPLLTLGQRSSKASESTLPGGMRLLFPVGNINNLSYTGNAGVVDEEQPALQLRAGAVWNREPLSVTNGFASAFRFRINGNAMRDSLQKHITLAFAIQNAGETAAAEGDCHAVLPNSVVVDLNLFGDLSSCQQERGIQLNRYRAGVPAAQNEALLLGRVGPEEIPPVDDGQTHLILVEYVPGQMNVYLDDLNRPLLSARIDLALSLDPNDGRAWLGFASPDAASQNLEIVEWWYWPISSDVSIDRGALASGTTLRDWATGAWSETMITPAAMPPGYCPGPANGPDNGIYQVLNPGSSNTIYTSEHFTARWNDSSGVPLTQSQVETGLKLLEYIWTRYITEISFSKPYANDAAKYKVDVNVSNQGWASGGGTGQRHPAMWLHYNAFQDPGALAHELTHSIQFATRGMRDSEYTGWLWESHAEWMRHQFFRDQVNCAELLVNYPHLYYGSTRNRYCNWQFWEFIKDRYCYRAVNDIWTLSKKPGEAGYRDEDPFTVLARNMGWSQSQLNDEFGEWALHNATWDYPNGNVYRLRFGSYADRAGLRRTRVTILQDLELERRRFVVPEFWAPQRWGYNLVRLVPDNSGQTGQNSTVTVTFKGVEQTAPASTDFGKFARQPATIPPPSSDWRWGLVARSSSGATRYSPMQRGATGRISFQVNPEDTELWLVVVATPATMHKILWDQIYYTIYRYPWMVEFQGAWPEGYPNATTPGGAGAPHPNGGGWVASTARVDPTAFIGPRAQVLGNAIVSGNARIDGWAIVRGNAQVRDNAVVEDFAQVLNGQVYENARVSALTVVNSSSARIHGSARVAAIMNAIGAYDISGTAQLIGDLELWTSLSRGVFYGFVDAPIAANPAYGANRTAPSPEVTVAGPFRWD